jgi:hypothetical protein
VNLKKVRPFSSLSHILYSGNKQDLETKLLDFPSNSVIILGRLVITQSTHRRDHPRNKAGQTAAVLPN